MAFLVMTLPPCVLHEDDDLLVVNKPPGWNTHAPSPYAGEGIYDWLRHREARWENLAIIHRLDKETSGVIVFSRSKRANQSLTEQFTSRDVSKKYRMLSSRHQQKESVRVVSGIIRAGERYVSQPIGTGETAETMFRVITQHGELCEIEAEPLTGRTHQIRVHASDHGFPILGDVLYGGERWPRVCLHAAEITFKHPGTGKSVTFTAPVNFEANATQMLRAACVNAEETNAFRIIHGAADGHDGLYIDRWGEYLLAQTDAPLSETERAILDEQRRIFGSRGCYHKVLRKQVAKSGITENSPKLEAGEGASKTFEIRENGVRIELSFEEGYSVGLFLDQRDNRRRLLVNHVAAGFPLFTDGIAGKEILNTFAYTCGFSVCAAKAGVRTTSLDLSKKYLEWGRRNLSINGIEPDAHDFIYGDTFDWLRRFGKKGRSFDLILLDPPTFSRSKDGVFKAGEDYGRLVTAALPVLNRGGVLFASTNAADLPPEKFIYEVRHAIASAGRIIEQWHYVPQPPDFPITRNEPGYLKTLWLRVK